MSKNLPQNYTRRDFTKIAALGVAATPFLNFQNGYARNLMSTSNDLEVHLFSKHLQFLNYDEMSKAAADIGFEGLDLTVRRKGHVLPENVKEDLPKAVSAMRKHGLSVKMMSTNVWDAKDTVNKNVIETAGELGFTHYRTDWLKYPEDTSIEESQLLFGKQARKLEQLNKKNGLIGGYQNHAGKNVGAPIWDLIPILEVTNGKNFGCQYDIRHAVVEGAGSWELGLKKILPYINSIVIKDFKWGNKNGKMKLVNVPLGEGMVDFKHYFSILKRNNINVPVSLHLEYSLGGAEKGKKNISMSKNEIFSYMKKDLTYLRETWKNA